MNRRNFGRLCAAAAMGGWGALSCSSAAAEGDVKAFDTRWTASPQWYQDAYADGYRLAVLSTNVWDQNAPSPQAAEQLGYALDAGLRIAAYTRNPRWYQAGIEACGPHTGQLSFFCLDVEIDPGVPVTHAMVDGVRSMGVSPLIYSSSGMWPHVMGNDTSFADLPLWDAAHGNPNWTPYGGWTGRVGVQTTEEAVFNGVAINLSSFSAGFLGV